MYFLFFVIYLYIVIIISIIIFIIFFSFLFKDVEKNIFIFEIYLSQKTETMRVYSLLCIYFIGTFLFSGRNLVCITLLFATGQSSWNTA